MIDWARVVELREEIGVEDFDEVVALFLSEVEERLETLKSKNATDALGDDLHFLKGSALNLGFTDFANLCNEGESRAADSDKIENIDAIHVSYAQSKTAFMNELSQQFSA